MHICESQNVTCTPKHKKPANSGVFQTRGLLLHTPSFASPHLPRNTTCRFLHVYFVHHRFLKLGEGRSCVSDIIHGERPFPLALEQSACHVAVWPLKPAIERPSSAFNLEHTPAITNSRIFLVPRLFLFFPLRPKTTARENLLFICMPRPRVKRRPVVRKKKIAVFEVREGKCKHFVPSTDAMKHFGVLYFTYASQAYMELGLSRSWGMWGRVNLLHKQFV